MTQLLGVLPATENSIYAKARKNWPVMASGSQENIAVQDWM